MKEILDNVTRVVSDSAAAVAKRTGEAVEVVKLRMTISSLEGQITDRYREIGKQVVDAWIAGDEDSPYAVSCVNIQDLQKQIHELEEKIAVLKNEKICSGCQVVFSRDANFCPNCGLRSQAE